ncbi:hypothetical protein LP420_27555 [Massilia sp. B-10]|nr:hypothetical protein LP420_27555 [Massilia sp. B-10]
MSKVKVSELPRATVLMLAPSSALTPNAARRVQSPLPYAENALAKPVLPPPAPCDWGLMPLP